MPSNKELQAEIEALKLQLSKANAPRAQGQLTIKRSEKGAVSVYGLGRFPVTLYAEQWTRLLSKSGEVTAFITANQATLSTKDKPIVAAAAIVAPVEAEPVTEPEAVSEPSAE